MSKEVKSPEGRSSEKDEQTFLDDPVQDRILAFSMALANELWVAKCQIERLETLLAKNEIVAKNEIDAPPSDQERANRQEMLSNFSAVLMETLKGKAASKSPDEETLNKFK
mgnify:CR=1 FL=1